MVASGLREFLRLVCFCPGWRAALDALRRGESAQALAEPERGGRSRWAGRMAAERLGLTEEPHPLQRLEECVRQGAGVRLYASKAAAAAAYRLLEPEA